jgi:putative transcriptional regulator
MANLNLTDHFLIAMPAVTDPYFSKSLVYIAEHNSQGALGLIVNRPININLGIFLEKIELPCKPSNITHHPVFFGGPVQPERGFVLHHPATQWQSTLAVNSEIGLTTSRDILESLADTGEPNRVIVALGYAGWGAGQLENELAQNSWLSVHANPGILFDTPYEDRFPAAMKVLGIDVTNFAGQAGHA